MLRAEHEQGLHPVLLHTLALTTAARGVLSPFPSLVPLWGGLSLIKWWISGWLSMARTDKCTQELISPNTCAHFSTHPLHPAEALYVCLCAYIPKIPTHAQTHKLCSRSPSPRGVPSSSTARRRCFVAGPGQKQTVGKGPGDRDPRVRSALRDPQRRAAGSSRALVFWVFFVFCFFSPAFNAVSDLVQ